MKKLLLAMIVSFAFCGSMFAQAYESHWPDFYYRWENQSGICAAIAINGQVYTVEDAGWDALEVAFFVGEEQRGYSFLDRANVDNYGDPYPITPGAAIGYNTPGELVLFQLWDHANSVLYTECEITYMDEPMVIYTGTDHFEAYLDEPYLPIILNFTGEVPAPDFTLDITGYGEGEGHYYLIASPVGAVEAGEVNNLMANAHDFYYFDQQMPGEEWVNLRGNAAYELQPGKGYLYANVNDVTLGFYGEAFAEGMDEGYVVPLTYEENAVWKGWNLVGNPYAATAYLWPEMSFYKMNEDGSDFIAYDGWEVAPMEGIFVVAESEEDVDVTFQYFGDKKYAVKRFALNLTNGRSVVDRAIVRFDECRQLPKAQLNSDHSKLYIPVADQDYAVVRSAEMGEMPVNFKAAQNGTYTISVNIEDVEFGYMHLIDNMTGADVDLLATPSYTFEASATDYASRFKLVFATGDSSKDDSFAFFSNGSFVISNEGEATLQVVDVTGRILKSETISGCANVHVDAAPGVYMLRLINGDNMKVQKVVVK